MVYMIMEICTGVLWVMASCSLVGREVSMYLKNIQPPPSGFDSWQGHHIHTSCMIQLDSHLSRYKGKKVGSM
jgi:hypothetical protein